MNKNRIIEKLFILHLRKSIINILTIFLMCQKNQ